MKKPEGPDEIYLQKVLNGDINAFSYFVDSYKDMSFSIARGMVKNDDLAEEIVQESFIKAFRNLKTFRGKSKFSTWFYKIIVNESKQVLRKNKRNRIEYSDDIGKDVNQRDSHQINNLTKEEQRKYINLALAKLSEKESLLLRLFYMAELNLQEIHEITGFSIANIKVILHRARNNFHAVLQKELKFEIRTIL